MDVDVRSSTDQGLLHGYLMTCGFGLNPWHADASPPVILYLDYLSTLPEEMALIWPRGWSRPSLLFFLNRYPPLLGDAVILLFVSSDLSNAVSTCHIFGIWRQVILILNQSVVCLLLVLRVSVLYRHALKVRLAIWCIALALLGVACWAVTGPSGYVVQNPLVTGCHIALSREVGIRTAIAWEAQAAFDIVSVVLTAYASWRTRRERPAKGSMIVNILLRDGAIYFLVMAAANVANILTFVISPPILKGVLSTLASSISISMMSRLILRLHNAALRSPSITFVDQSVEQMPSVGMVFATRLEPADGVESTNEERE